MGGENFEIIAMMRDLNRMHYRQKSSPLPEGITDHAGYALEAEDAFSTDPLGFAESTLKLEFEAAETFRLLRRLNRHSPVFYDTASVLEKQLSRLGSLIITAALMEQQGAVSGFLKGLKIGTLRERTAFVFRKCYASCMESAEAYRLNSRALALSVRYADLDRRLQATEEKIEAIRAGKLKPEAPSAEKRTEAPAGSLPDAAADAAEDGARPFPMRKQALPIVWDAVQAGRSESPAVPGEMPEAPAAELPEALPEVLPAPLSREETGRLQDRDAGAEGHPLPQYPVPGLEEEDGAEELPLPYGDIEFPGEDEDDLPFVSEDLVRRMSEMIRQQEMAAWPFPRYEYAGLDPPEDEDCV